MCKIQTFLRKTHIALLNYYAVWILPCHIHAKNANKILCKVVLNLLIVSLHLKQLGLLPLNLYVFLIFICAEFCWYWVTFWSKIISINDTLFDINVWIIFMSNVIWIQIKDVKNIWARQKETEKMKKRLKKIWKRKKMKEWNLCLTYAKLMSQWMSYSCLVYV